MYKYVFFFLSSSHIDNKIADMLSVKMLQSGMAGGMETLCGQAFGAKQYQKLGTCTYSAIISLTLICLPVCVLWIFMDKFLSLVGQDPLIFGLSRSLGVLQLCSPFGRNVLVNFSLFKFGFNICCIFF